MRQIVKYSDNHRNAHQPETSKALKYIKNMLTKLGRYINKLLMMLFQLGKQLNQDYMIVRKAMTPF